MVASHNPAGEGAAWVDGLNVTLGRSPGGAGGGGAGGTSFSRMVNSFYQAAYVSEQLGNRSSCVQYLDKLLVVHKAALRVLQQQEQQQAAEAAEAAATGVSSEESMPRVDAAVTALFSMKNSSSRSSNVKGLVAGATRAVRDITRACLRMTFRSLTAPQKAVVDKTAVTVSSGDFQDLHDYARQQAAAAVAAQDVAAVAAGDAPRSMLLQNQGGGALASAPSAESGPAVALAVMRRLLEADKPILYVEEILDAITPIAVNGMQESFMHEPVRMCHVLGQMQELVLLQQLSCPADTSDVVARPASHATRS